VGALLQSPRQKQIKNLPSNKKMQPQQLSSAIVSGGAKKSAFLQCADNSGRAVWTDGVLPAAPEVIQMNGTSATPASLPNFILSGAMYQFDTAQLKFAMFQVSAVVAWIGGAADTTVSVTFTLPLTGTIFGVSGTSTMGVIPPIVGAGVPFSAAVAATGPMTVALFFTPLAANPVVGQDVLVGASFSVAYNP
jgi:hypothetical protein